LVATYDHESRAKLVAPKEPLKPVGVSVGPGDRIAGVVGADILAAGAVTACAWAASAVDSRAANARPERIISPCMCFSLA
jgi:hypothetical protein